MAWRFPESSLYRLLSFPKAFHQQYGDLTKQLALSGYYAKNGRPLKLSCYFDERHNVDLTTVSPFDALKKHKCYTDVANDIPTAEEDYYLNYASHRLLTFLESQKWDNKYISNFDAAVHGLYYTGVDEICRCYFCKVEIRRFNDDGSASVIHQRASPLCPIAHRKECKDGDVRFGEDVVTTEQGIVLLHTSFENTEKDVKRRSKFPHLALEKDRFATFDDFFSLPWYLPSSMVKSGFFYSGFDDLVVCFHCAGAINNWDEEHDPWIEHAKHFPHCKFLLDTRGKEFVKSAYRLLRPFKSMLANAQLLTNVSECVKSVILPSTPKFIVY